MLQVIVIVVLLCMAWWNQWLSIILTLLSFSHWLCEHACGAETVCVSMCVNACVRVCTHASTYRMSMLCHLIQTLLIFFSHVLVANFPLFWTVILELFLVTLSKPSISQSQVSAICENSISHGDSFLCNSTSLAPHFTIPI